MTTPQQSYAPSLWPAWQRPNPQEHYDANQHEVPETTSPAQGGQPAPSAGGRRKRNYAGQAYEFGGVNATLGGQQQGGGAYPPPPGGGYGQPGSQLAPAYGSGPASPAMGVTPGYGQHPSAVGGYQSPDPVYPTQGAPHVQPNVGGITQGMGNMNVGGHAQHQPQPQQMQMQGRSPMNQLYPTDLLNQPLSVSELDLPPPPIILPPNVSREGSPS